MYYSRKLRPKNFTPEFLIPIIVLPAFLILLKLFGPQAAYLFLAPVFAVTGTVGLIIWIKTRNIGHLMLFFMMVLITIMSIIFIIYGKGANRPLMGALIVGLLILIPLVIYFTISKKNKWRARELLEMAAMPVKDIESGFTERPLPVGKLNYTTIEMEDFLKFLRKNLIALPVYDNDKIVLVINYSYKFILGFENKYLDKTYVSIDSDGNVLTHISRGDYMQYRDQYAFDQLCESLGNLMINYFDLFRKGEGARIIDQMNDLRLNPFTEG
jgi:hypothetical protein